MSNILNSEDFGLKIYNRFPPKYREDDTKQNYALRRYLQALGDGGFKYAIDDINGITDLIDPVKVDAKVLPILFKQYGLEIFNGIPEEYLRYLLPRLGEAWSKKGSLGVIEFISSSITGIKTSTNLIYDLEENPLIDVILEMDYNTSNYFPEIEQFRRLLKNFIPFYCDIFIVYSYLYYETQNLAMKEGNNIFVITQEESEKIKSSYTTKENVTEKTKESSILRQPFKSYTNSVGLLNNSFYTNSIYCYDKITVGDTIEVIYN